MSLQIVSAPRASTPYPWFKFAQWMRATNLSAEEIQTMIENGAEPSAQLVLGNIDDSVVYPGLPTLDGLTLDDHFSNADGGASFAILGGNSK